MTYNELSQCNEKSWTTTANSQGATGYFIWKDMVYKWEAESGEPYVYDPISFDVFFAKNKHYDDPVIKEMLRYIEEKEYDRKFSNCEMKWIIGGPDSGGVRGVFLYENDLFNWASEYMLPEEMKPFSVESFLRSNRNTTDERIKAIVEYLDSRADRR